MKCFVHVQTTNRRENLLWFVNIIKNSFIRLVFDRLLNVDIGRCDVNGICSKWNGTEQRERASETIRPKMPNTRHFFGMQRYANFLIILKKSWRCFEIRRLRVVLADIYIYIYIWLNAIYFYFLLFSLILSQFSHQKNRCGRNLFWSEYENIRPTTIRMEIQCERFFETDKLPNKFLVKNAGINMNAFE